MSVEGWQPLPAGSSLPPAVWGKDHFSTLAYLETCAVDHSGSVSNARLRCDERLHPAVVDRLPVEARDYPTILRGGKLQAGHDDWSCIEDFVAAGLLMAYYLDRNVAQEMYSGARITRQVRVSFTHAGIRLAHSLRAWKMLGGTYATFEPEAAE